MAYLNNLHLSSCATPVVAERRLLRNGSLVERALGNMTTGARNERASRILHAQKSVRVQRVSSAKDDLLSEPSERPQTRQQLM